MRQRWTGAHPLQVKALSSHKEPALRASWRAVQGDPACILYGHSSCLHTAGTQPCYFLAPDWLLVCSRLSLVTEMTKHIRVRANSKTVSAWCALTGSNIKGVHTAAADQHKFRHGLSR